MGIQDLRCQLYSRSDPQDGYFNRFGVGDMDYARKWPFRNINFVIDAEIQYQVRPSNIPRRQKYCPKQFTP